MASPCCEGNAQAPKETAGNFGYRKMKRVRKGEETPFVRNALIDCRFVVPANTGIPEIESVSDNPTSAFAWLGEQRVHSRRPPGIGPHRGHPLASRLFATFRPRISVVQDSSAQSPPVGTVLTFVGRLNCRLLDLKNRFSSYGRITHDVQNGFFKLFYANGKFFKP